jgi:hypothetical protein
VTGGRRKLHNQDIISRRKEMGGVCSRHVKDKRNAFRTLVENVKKRGDMGDLEE